MRPLSEKPMNSTPSTSIIMIFFNAAAFIEEAIESVLRQTDTDWELLLVDDGSTDGSTELAMRCAAREPSRIRYLQHPGHENRGMSASRNRGIADARGEFIAFLDADDVWLPERLQRHVEVLQAHEEVGMVFGPTLFWWSWAGPAALEGPQDYTSDLHLESGRTLAPPILLYNFLESGGRNLPGIGSLLARRHIVQRVGSFEESFRGCFEDQVFLAKMWFHTPVFVLDQALDRYRQHPDSCCHQAIKAGVYDPLKPNGAREKYLTWLDDYLRAHAPDDQRLMKALEGELWPYRRPLSHALDQVPAIRLAKSALRRCLGSSGYAWLRRLSAKPTRTRAPDLRV